MRRSRMTLLIAAAIGAAAILAVYGARLFSGGLAGVPAAELGLRSAEAANIPREEVASMPAEKVEGMEGVAASGELALYVNKATAEIAVRDLRSGRLWYSNPPDRDQDPLAAGINKEKLNSQMSIVYENHTLQSYSMNSYSDSVKNGQVGYEPIPNGIKVTYTFGKAEGNLDTLPIAMSKERYEELILAKAGDDYGRYLNRAYKLNEERGVYERLDVALSGIVLERVKAAFELAGYAEEDLRIDNQENGGPEAAADQKVFKASIEYIVDGPELVVRVPTAEIEYPASYPITRVTVLDYFGAGGADDEGYMLVPDGSGSLIRFNNGKVDSDAYFEPVYGRNEVKVQPTKSSYGQVSRLPVYGMRNNEQAFLAMIEQGDAVATIRADIGGKVHSYNYVFSEFELLAQDYIQVAASAKSNNVAISSNVQLPVYQQERMSTDFVIRYAFLNGEDADYAGMARYYQKHLVRQGILDKLEPQEAMPFFLELVGGIPKRKSFMGVPYEDLQPLTTFGQAQEILEALLDGGVRSIQLRYLGWFNGGVNHELPTAVKPDEELGGREGLEKLADFAKKRGVALYPDVALTRVYHDSDSFRPSRHAARYLTKKPALIYPYNPATFRRDPSLPADSYYVLSSRFLPEVTDKFAKAYRAYELDGVSLRELGDALNADYRDGQTIDRAQAKRIVQQQLGALAESGLDLMAAGGNGYVLPHVDKLVDIPMSDSGYHITDESVPFYQLVLHGYADYAGQPINLAETADPRLAMLKALETGASLYFTWSYAPSSEVKETAFNHLYSIHYAYWLEQATRMYAELNEAVGHVRHEAIVDRRKLENDVVQVTYEGGLRVIVNYGVRDVNVQGLTIKGRDYAVVGERS
ncbi:DUF5696 domain-containing protein [Cohnella hongkongensis]|uniref:DUF5696 domain-containing protein n=1 Tax=Cohnella hongkongensis TaxID=178337 RepID=A0ABV9FFU3_9BACL